VCIWDYQLLKPISQVALPPGVTLTACAFADACSAIVLAGSDARVFVLSFADDEDGSVATD
jgi:hypothetical protein